MRFLTCKIIGMHSFDKHLRFSSFHKRTCRTEGKTRWISQRNIPLIGRESERWRRWCWLWWLLPSNAIHLSDCRGLVRPDLLHFIYSCHVYLLLGRKKRKDHSHSSFSKMIIYRFWTCNMKRTWVDQSEKRHLYPTKVIIASIEIEHCNTSLSQYCICQTCMWLVQLFINFIYIQFYIYCILAGDNLKLYVVKGVCLCSFSEY